MYYFICIRIPTLCFSVNQIIFKINVFNSQDLKMYYYLNIHLKLKEDILSFSFSIDD